MEDINSHAMLNELLKRSDEKDPGGFPVCLYHYIGESVKLYLRHDAVIKHINLKQCEHKQLNEVSECIKCGQVITVIKQVSTPHPSDSDIDEASIEFAEKENTNGHDDYIRIMNVYSEGMKAMRDRMNGEMCAFAEWIANNYINFNIVPDGIYMDMKDLLKHKSEATPYTTEQLLQKFRNRDL